MCGRASRRPEELDGVNVKRVGETEDHVEGKVPGAAFHTGDVLLVRLDPPRDFGL